MQNKKYRIELEKHSRSKRKHTCPECNIKGVFVRYIDTETYNYISDEVGRCDRQFECGYHYPPRHYFEKNRYYPKEYNKYKNLSDVSGKIKFRFTMDNSVMAATLNKSENNNLVKFLINRFDPQQVDDAIINYNVGTINKWPGATVFWQVSITNEIRTGKIILYNEKTGKRVKEPFPHIAWMHTAYLDINSQIKQCLFGEHLLAKEPKNTVGVVESEKTAIIASLVCPELTWVAVGGANNLNPIFCEALTGRNVILYPDTDAHNLWSEKANLLADKMNITVSDDLQNDTEFVKNHKGADLADYFLYLLSSTDSNLQPA
jgi:hypothetical protein